MLTVFEDQQVGQCGLSAVREGENQELGCSGSWGPDRNSW